LASGETTNAPARKSPPVLDLTGPGEKSQTSGNQKGREASPESKRPTPVKATAHKVVKPHKVQRRPSERKPGRATVRKAGEPPSIPKDDACASLPGAVIWKNLRPDHRQAMLGGFKYYDALDRILDDREIHGFFRQPQLIKMLVSMMYWRRLDSTPRSKYVPETFYEMADERLDRLLARGDVPPPWEAPDEHIDYPDEDVDSTVDDTNADPDFKPLEHAVSDGSASSSSGEDSDEAEFADPASVKSTSKRGRSSSDSDAPLVVAVNAKRQKSSSGSARQGSGRQGTGHS